MAMGATLLNLRCVVIMLLLFRSAEALQRKASALNLASMSIYSADLQLRKQSTALGAHCALHLEEARASLHRASTQLVSDPHAAHHSLALVDDILKSCAPNSQHAMDLLSRVAQSVASAKHHINHLGKAPDDVSTSLITTRVEDIAEAVSSVSMHDDLVVDFCPDHVALRRSSATICLNRACGGKFHTRARYAAGVFSMRMRAPQGAPGVSNSFYISSNDAFPDSISFDFVGHEPHRVLTSYAVAGNHSQKHKIFHMSFDTTAEFHEYTIKWDAKSIIWIVDGVILRRVRSSSRKPFPTKSGHVFGYSWVADQQRVSWDVEQYFMSFRDLQVKDPDQWLLPRQPAASGGLRPLVIDYCPSNIAVGESSVEISFDQRGCGGRVRSLRRFSSGRFSARVQCAAGDTSGLLTSFYLSSGEGSATQDEVDFEFLGDKKSIVQTNFYVNGSCGANEQWVELGFDCSSAFHEYAVEFSESWIRWFVDDRLVRTVTKDDVGRTAGIPSKKMYLYSSVWNASFVNDGVWTGKWHGMGEVPFVAKFKDVTKKL